MTFVGRLYGFQRDVIDWSKSLDKGIIGLDMGLGKTVITISMIARKSYKCTVIVVPLPIIEQWKESLKRFTDLSETDICIHQGPSRKKQILNQYKIILTTYDVVRNDIDDKTCPLSTFHSFDSLILDEAHKIRNRKTDTYKSCSALGKHTDNKWLLSGTSINNDFNDFVSLCQFLEIEISKDKLEEVKNKYYYRLTKKDCLLNLPEKSIQQHYLNFDEKQADYYQGILNRLKDAYEDYEVNHNRDSISHLLTTILRLRQCCNYSGSDSVKFQKITNILSNIKNEKVIIFSQWEKSLTMLQQHLDTLQIKHLKYHGKLNTCERAQILQQFQNDDHVNVLLMTIQSGGVGLDLTVANNCIILDPCWNNAIENQAIDRIYRIGQHKPVQVHQLYINDSIETWVNKLKKEKKIIDEEFHMNSKIYIRNTSLLKKLLWGNLGSPIPPS
jgi:SNF2 family DNA or RNA helicase